MSDTAGLNFRSSKSKAAGWIKITAAVRKLLLEKSYHDITWGEIARTAGVSEALIYQHFKDRPGLLCGVIEELLTAYVQEQRQNLQGTYGALNKLRRIIRTQIHTYNRDRVFAKILLLEVRSYPLFFESGAYRIIKDYGNMILEIIKEGVYNGEIRKDATPEHIRQVVLGAIEHFCLPNVIFGREFSTDELTDEACRIVFSGIATAALPIKE
jgi:AcrR family transcriptional regulator